MSPDVKKALNVLFLGEAEATPDSVRSAYRRAAVVAHPDHGGTSDALTALVKARDLVLAWLARQPCETCVGTGRVPHAQGFYVTRLTCQTCHGAGLKWPEKK